MGTKRIPKWTPVVITWTDALTDYSPSHSEDLQTTIVDRRTIGFLIANNKEKISVAMEDDRAAGDVESDCQTVTHIPKKMVKKIDPLTPLTTLPKCGSIKAERPPITGQPSTHLHTAPEPAPE